MVQGVIIENNHILNTNPATGDLISKVPITPPDTIPTIVQNARIAQQDSWSSTPLTERIQLLKNAVAKLTDVKTELVKLMTSEMGKPLLESEGEVDDAINKDAFLDLIQKANEDVVLEKEGNKNSSVIVRDPLGVVLIVTPWNYPCGEIILQILPALAAGNTAIVKPSEVAPQSGGLTVTTLASALPPNVIQLVQGDGTTGSILVNSDNIDMVAMTGSVAVGKTIMSNCATNLKRLVLEMGGKDPMVIFKDADLDKAADDAVKYSLSNAGQMCCAIERIYIEDAVKTDFEEKVVKAAKNYKVGDGNDYMTGVGPMCSLMQKDRVAEQVDGAIKDGAKVLYKSDIPADTKGNYYPVTVLSDLKQEMDIQQKETFGPVVAIATFDGTEDEAIRLANDTEYGLCGCVYSADKEKARRVARRVRSGQVGINCFSLECADMACPFVGHKSSGFGYHSGMDGFRQFSVPKSLVFKG